MRTLFLLRHAKSSWDDASLADFDRPLNGRGERAASFMGKLMKEKGFSPDAILSSPASRTKATAKLVHQAAGLVNAVRYIDRIYESSAQRLRDIVAMLDDDDRSAMLVGHNPGIEGLIRFLTGRAERMPTAALAVIDLDIDRWSKITEGAGELRALYRPRDVMGRPPTM